MMQKMLNGEVVDMTPEEEAAVLAERAAHEAGALDRAKLAKRREINAARDAAEDAGFDYLGKRFDSDAQAIKRLYGAAMAAQAAMAAGVLPGDYFVDWTCADGSVKSLTYAEAADLVVAMAPIGAALHGKARALKAQIDAATTVGEVEVVGW